MSFDPIVCMDTCHVQLIKSVTMSAKPLQILELGIGSGDCTKALLEACAFNRMGHITSVDNWFDWQGIRPPHIPDDPRLTVIVTNEGDFIAGCQTSFDLIVSDGDHFNSHIWALDTLKLLTPTGIAFFHDVSNSEFPNLEAVREVAGSNGMNTVLFSRSTRIDERCERGLLVVFNGQHATL